MNGKAFSHMIDTLKTISHKVGLTDPLIMVDDSCIALLRVSTCDGTPVFGGVSDGTVDLGPMIRTKIPSDEFDIHLEPDGVNLTNDDDRIVFKVLPDYYNAPRIPDVICPKVDSFKADKLLELMNSIATDYVIIHADDDTLKGTCESPDGAKRTLIIGKVDSGHYGLNTVYPTAFLKSIIKTVKGTVELFTDTDYPLRMEWTDGFYQYVFYLAPKIIED